MMPGILPEWSLIPSFSMFSCGCCVGCGQEPRWYDKAHLGSFLYSHGQIEAQTARRLTTPELFAAPDPQMR